MFTLKQALRIIGVIAVSCIFTVSVAHAGKFGVRVLDATTGLPVANAAVCIGTVGDRTLYGTAITSYSGVALYEDVPDSAVLITVSKKNYRGMSLHNPATSDNVIADVLLTEGITSRKCRALKYVDLKPGITDREYKNEWPLEITTLSYFPSGDDGLAFLSYTSGKPTHYRVSTKSDFSDAQWKPYTDVFEYSPNSRDVGKELLYFQVRKHIDAEGGSMEAMSAVYSQPVNIS